MSNDSLQAKDVANKIPLPPKPVLPFESNCDMGVGNKSKWLTYLGYVTAAFIVVATSISIGGVIGYTYCYLEHLNNIRGTNFTQETNVRIVELPKLLGERTQKTNNTMGSDSVMIISRVFTLAEPMMPPSPNKTWWHLF